MYIETLYSKSLDELDRIVDEFTTDKIIYDIKYQQLHLGWNIHIFYDNILEEDGKTEYSDKVRLKKWEYQF